MGVATDRPVFASTSVNLPDFGKCAVVIFWVYVDGGTGVVSLGTDSGGKRDFSLEFISLFTTIYII